MPTLNILFWAFFASYVMHILDETLLNGGFVQWIKDNFWPTYHMRMFFWFNAAFLVAIAGGNVLFDSFGGHWVILPIIFVARFVTHAFTVHAYWSVRRNTYSPGLLTSTLYVVIFYLLIRYGLGGHLYCTADGAESRLVHWHASPEAAATNKKDYSPRVTKRSLERELVRLVGAWGESNGVL